MIKTLKLRIHKPQGDVEWTELGNILRDLMYASAKMKNHAVLRYYLNMIEEDQSKKMSKKAIDRLIYHELTTQFPMVATLNINATQRTAWNSLKTVQKTIFKLDAQLPTFKKNQAAHISAQSYDILFDNGTYFIDVQLHSKAHSPTRYTFSVYARDKSTRTILERITNGQYKMGAAQITRDRKSKWYFNVAYEFEKEVKPLDSTRIMGVDLGISYAAYWAFTDSFKRGYIEGGEIENFKSKVTRRRKQIQHQAKHAGDSRTGHGRKRVLFPIESLSERESNFRNTCNHRYTRRIVNEAVKHGCGTIQIEDLTGISDNKDTKFLKNWPYYDLQTKIEDKANEHGITVIKVNPAYTSQRCSNCGYIHIDNRLTQKWFVCQECNYGNQHLCKSCNHIQDAPGTCGKCHSETKYLRIKADYNAARNLATKNIEELIKQQINKQRES